MPWIPERIVGMNMFMIYLSIFCFGVSAGLVLSRIIASQGVYANRRRRDWKNRH